MKMRITELRNDRGLTQADLADLVGVREATISQLENGRNNPRLSTLQKIASGLQVTVLDLFEPCDSDPDELALVEAFRRSSPVERAALLTLMRQRPAKGDK